MSVRWERFSGDTSKFAIKIAFHADPDEGQGIDSDVAVSWGALQIWVDGINLCTHVDQDETLQSSHWYLLPILEWLASSWDPLLHEERLPFPANRFETAADISGISPALVMSGEPPERALETDNRRFEWEQRHSLRSARDGGILPDVWIRRFQEQVEISWNNSPLAGAVDVEFVATKGRSIQDLSEVAGPLYEVLRESIGWLRSQMPDSKRLELLATAVSELRIVGGSC